MSWQRHPVFINSWPQQPWVDYAIFIDENGDANLKHVRKCLSDGFLPEDGNRFMQVTGCCMHRNDVEQVKEATLTLKMNHWPEGLFQYKGTLKRVCLHSREIRERTGPFCCSEINYPQFINELTDTIVGSNFSIASITIDKYGLVKKYINPYDPYCVAIEFLLERLLMNNVPNNKKCILILEARNLPDDKILLNKIMMIIRHGTQYCPATMFNRIAGVYFNPKWCREAKERKSYFGLEIADLVGHPIYKYMALGKQDRAYLSIKHKITHHGTKKFP